MLFDFTFGDVGADGTEITTDDDFTQAVVLCKTSKVRSFGQACERYRSIWWIRNFEDFATRKRKVALRRSRRRILYQYAYHLEVSVPTSPAAKIVAAISNYFDTIYPRMRTWTIFVIDSFFEGASQSPKSTKSQKMAKGPNKNFRGRRSKWVVDHSFYKWTFNQTFMTQTFPLSHIVDTCNQKDVADDKKKHTSSFTLKKYGGCWPKLVGYWRENVFHMPQPNLMYILLF